MNSSIAQQIADEGGVEAYLHAQQHKSLLRFLTCGSVDDGKSTLIGRLLHDTRQIYEDQLSSLHNDSKRHGTQGERLDLALLVDGLQAEREQGITIDVAYRYFLHREAQIYYCRHAGARAVHPQHGDRRIHLRPGDPADRRT
jgi:sulfate adenylyltransferase subunit 1 (EC 2.7.7.4)